MPTLKEIKGRIGSVKNTLKITSAMKLVASAKLRKAQNAIEAMRPYEAQLQRMLATVSGSVMPAPVLPDPDRSSLGSVMPGPDRSSPAVIIAIASNSSLCGSFNANAIAQVRSIRRPGDVVYAIGRKMADAMRKDGFPSPMDFTHLAEHPAYAPAAELVEKLAEEAEAGRIGQVLLVYNHFVSSARQVPVVEMLLEGTKGKIPGQAGDDAPAPVMTGPDRSSLVAVMPDPDRASDVILEPGAKELRALLLPKTLKLKLYAALLDSVAAEHAARTIAMQTATDNGNQLLDELTLQYNKGRQQKITNEILDLAGGQQN